MLCLNWFCLSIVLLSARATALQHRSVRQTQPEVCPLPTNIDPCDYSPCDNGAGCMKDYSIIDCFKCNCLSGFTGTYCETPDTVTPGGCNPVCANGGTCNGNICSCPTGFTGTSCESRNFCAPSNPCQNGGLCASDASSYRCDCTNTGFTGPICAERVVIDPCQSSPCQNSGRCSVNSNGAVSCICINSFSGIFCQIPPLPCASAPCQNDGTCDSVGNSFACVCKPGFTGKQCENSVIATHPCVTSPTTVCQNGATCTINGADYVCQCTNGWSGKNCETQQFSPTCNPNPCGANGNCTLASLPSGPLAICFCRDRWTGKYCDVNLDLVCSSGYCENGGTCQINGNARVCSCPPTYTGERCAQQINNNNNSSTTTTTTTTTVSTIIVNRCVPTPCLNGGTCFNNGNSFVCACPAQYTGVTCNIQLNSTTPVVPNVNPCTSYPCLNSGSCFRTGNDYVCVCTSAYVGNRCEIAKTTTPSNPITNGPTCTARPCLNGGSCFNTGTTYFCYCGLRFTGKNCETIV